MLTNASAVLRATELLHHDVGSSGLATLEPFKDLLSYLSDTKRQVGEIEEGIERIRQIVSDLRVFARPDAGPERCDVLDALRWALRVTEVLLESRARLDLDLQPVPPVQGNASRLGQVFVNLLINAAQSIPEGKREEHRIAVCTSWNEEHGVTVAIQDTGAGMTPSVLQRIFDPFYTTKPVGAGIGLGPVWGLRCVVASSSPSGGS